MPVLIPEDWEEFPKPKPDEESIFAVEQRKSKANAQQSEMFGKEKDHEF